MGTTFVYALFFMAELEFLSQKCTICCFLFVLYIYIEYIYLLCYDLLCVVTLLLINTD